jgi:hypothetical protein
MIAILHSKKLKKRKIEVSLGESPESRHHAYYSLDKIKGQVMLTISMDVLF